MPLVAVQVYNPLWLVVSDRITIVLADLVPDTPLLIKFLFLLHFNDGLGCPVALQVTDTRLFARYATISGGLTVNSGRTFLGKEKSGQSGFCCVMYYLCSFKLYNFSFLKKFCSSDT